MRKSNAKKNAAKRSVNELIEWFDKNDTGGYLEKMPEVHFEIDIKRTRHLVELEPDLADRLAKLARAKRVSSRSLVNSWVREKISGGDLAR